MTVTSQRQRLREASVKRNPEEGLAPATRFPWGLSGDPAGGVRVVRLGAHREDSRLSRGRL